MYSKEMMILKFLDLFAGVGGFRLGLEMAGHECVGHSECDPFCNKCGEITLHKNHETLKDHSVCTVCGTPKKQYALASYYSMHKPKEEEYHATDVRNIKPEDLPDFDILTGGFPCQSFSIAGKGGGFTDTRGTLFFEIMRIARVRKPKYLFLENVKGLFSHDGGKTFGTILSTLWECGYDAEWQVCNSKNYGVPHNRERVFIVAQLRGGDYTRIFPIRYGKRKVNEIEISERLRTNIAPIFKVAMSESTRRNIASGFYFRDLTPKEYFRLQGFPDDYYERASKVSSKNQLYKQAGNSVTVPVIYEIGRRLK